MTTRSPQNNTSSTFLYDALNRVTNVTHNFTGATGTLAYAYDEVGNRKYMQRGNGLTDGFGYDLNNQVTSFRRNGTLTGGTVTGGTLTSLVFDASGNRTSVVENGTTTSYPSANNLNQYPSVGGKGATYDGKGNLYSYDGWTYTYDAMNRLTAVSGPGGVTGNFWYDGFNRICTWQVNGSANARFNVWDGWNLVAEYKAGNVLDVEYLRGAGTDEMVSMTRAGQTYYFFQDGTGNTSHITNSSGTQLESYRYGLNGKPTVYDPAGNIRATGTAYGVRHLFAGLDWHEELSLIDYRNRFESIGTRKFMQPDPIGFAGDPANLYRYCANNPVNASDPMGTTVVPGVGSNVPAINDAIDYLQNSPTFAGIYGGLQSSATVYTIQTNSNAVDSFRYQTTTVNWDPSAWLVTSNGSIQSPAQVLAHELAGHAGDWEANPSQYQIDRRTDLNNNYDNEEEHHAGETETKIAGQLGEGTRSDHRGTLVQVPPSFFLWLTAFPDSLLAHLLADSPTMQNLRNAGYGSNGNSHASQHVSGPPPPNFSFAYVSQSKNQ